MHSKIVLGLFLMTIAVLEYCQGYTIKKEKQVRFLVEKRTTCDKCYVGDTMCASPTVVRQALSDVDEDGTCLRCTQSSCKYLAEMGVHPRVLSDCWARTWYRGCADVCGDIPESLLEREANCRECLKGCEDEVQPENIAGITEIIDIRICVSNCIADGTCPNKRNFTDLLMPLLPTQCGICVTGYCQNTFFNYGIMASVTCYNDAVQKCGDCSNLPPKYDLTYCGVCFQGCKNAIRAMKDNKREDDNELANTRINPEMRGEGSADL